MKFLTIIFDITHFPPFFSFTVKLVDQFTIAHASDVGSSPAPLSRSIYNTLEKQFFTLAPLLSVTCLLALKKKIRI